MPKVEVGSRLRELRRERGLPLSVLAARARVGLQTLVNAEKWAIPLPRKAAERIARVLEIPLDDLLESDGEVNQP